MAAPASPRDDTPTHRVIKGRRWRVSDPAVDADLRQLLVNALMKARRDVKAALADRDDDAVDRARGRVHDAKVALGERGPRWWEPMTADDVAVRVACAGRALESIGERTGSDVDVRSRLHLDAMQTDAPSGGRP